MTALEQTSESRLRAAGLPAARVAQWETVTDEGKQVFEWRVVSTKGGQVLAVAATEHEAVSRAIWLWGSR